MRRHDRMLPGHRRALEGLGVSLSDVLVIGLTPVPCVCMLHADAGKLVQPISSSRVKGSRGISRRARCVRCLQGWTLSDYRRPRPPNGLAQTLGQPIGGLGHGHRPMCDNVLYLIRARPLSTSVPGRRLAVGSGPRLIWIVRNSKRPAALEAMLHGAAKTLLQPLPSRRGEAPQNLRVGLCQAPPCPQIRPLRSARTHRSPRVGSRRECPPSGDRPMSASDPEQTLTWRSDPSRPEPN